MHNAFPDFSDNQSDRLPRLRSRQHADTVAGRAAAGHSFIRKEAQAALTSTAPFTSGVHIARHDTANAAGHTCAELQPP